MTVWAWRTDRVPTDAARGSGCPASGWIHAGDGPPWQVIAADTLEILRAACEIPDARAMVYTGGEPTVDVREWLDRAGPGVADERLGAL